MKFGKRHIKKQSDEALMLAICNGNQQAFSELYLRFNERLFYFFYRMLGGDKELANDFLQDIFMKIIDKPELYKKGNKFSSWIFTIAHNMCKNEYRRRDVRKVVNNEANPDQFINDVNQNDYLEKEALITKVFSELESLEENHRSILILKYKENFSLKEISNILDLPIGTIKSRLHYARIELSKRVSENKTV